MMMMKSIAQEVAPYRIRVNSITGATIYVDESMMLYPGFETGG